MMILIIIIFIFDDVFAKYLELNESGLTAVISIMAVGFFGGGCYRAITLSENIEALILGSIPVILAVILLVIYLKLITSKYSQG